MNSYLLVTICVVVVMGGMIAYAWFIKDLFIFLKTIIFWNKMYREGGYATEYFNQSAYWKIEAVNEGVIKGWYGPYSFKSYGFTFYIYCKTDDASKYWNDFLVYKQKGTNN